jgi:hypothetical protein
MALSRQVEAVCALVRQGAGQSVHLCVLACVCRVTEGVVPHIEVKPHPDADSILKRAMADLATLVEDRAPGNVITAAREAIACYKCGIHPPLACWFVLSAYSRARAKAFGVPSYAQ